VGFAGRTVGVVGRRRVLEVRHIVEGEVARMPVVVEGLRIAVEGIGLAELRRRKAAEMKDILAVVGMGYGLVHHMAVVAVADKIDYTGLVVVGILLAARIFVKELASHGSPAEEGILVVGKLEGDIVQGAAVGILLLCCQ